MTAETIDTVVVGGGQAGLAMSAHLRDGGVEHVVLERSRIAISECLSTIENNRVGLVLFAGSASIACPLTLDHDFFLQALDEAGPDSVAQGGTRITDALMRLAVAAIAFLSAYALVVKSCGIEKACITSNLSIEHRPFFFVLAAAMAFYGAQSVFLFLSGLTHWNDARDPHEAED